MCVDTHKGAGRTAADDPRHEFRDMKRMGSKGIGMKKVLTGTLLFVVVVLAIGAGTTHRAIAQNNSEKPVMAEWMKAVWRHSLIAPITSQTLKGTRRQSFRSS